MHISATEALNDHQTEVMDLRVEIMSRGAIAPLLILGWSGAFLGLLGADAQTWPSIVFNAGLLLLGGASALLLISRRRQAALWLCGYGGLVMAVLHWLAFQSPFSIVWMTISAGLVTLLIGERSGWAATITVCLALAAVAWGNPHGPIQPENAIQAALPVAASGLLSYIVSQVLFRTLAWMSAGYLEARRESEAHQAKSGELAQALKSLDQTSLALARANEQLRIMVQFAEDARRSKQEFAANISHELRSPLNLIIGFSDIVANALSGQRVRTITPELLADLDAIHRNARHLLMLVNDILDLSQMDVSYMTIQREPIDLGECIRSAVEDVQQLVHARRLQLNVEISPDLPLVEADRTRIRQVLLNLLNNSLRFTSQGGLDIRARWVKGEGSDEPGYGGGHGEVVVSVHDTGTGIPKDLLARVFEPFVQAGGAAGQQAGTGLGLTISKRFVELHGGRMWAESEVGVGSTFYFALPVHRLAPNAPIVSLPHRIQRYEIGRLAVVETSPLLTRLLERYLSGIQVAWAASFDELAERAQEWNVEAVVVNTPDECNHALPILPDGIQDLPVFQCYVPGLFDRTYGMAGPGTDNIGVDFGAGAENGGGDSMHRRGHGPLVCGYLVKPVTGELLAQAVAQMLAVSDCAAAPAGDKAGRQTAHLLVVDDDEDTLRMVSRMLRIVQLENAPFTKIIPIKARSGAQAIDRLLAEEESPRIDGVLLDLGLGDMTGFDVLRELQRSAIQRRWPVYIISGYDAHGEALIAPRLTITRRAGFTVRELTEAIAAGLAITVPGLAVRAESRIAGLSQAELP